MRRHWLLILLLALVAASRFVILFQSQTHVHSDEAVIGLMGKHILEGRCFPFYMYGQPYNACAAWEACLAVVPFAIFGVGVIPLKGCIVVLSLVCLVLFYRMADRLYDRRTAILASLVFALLPSLLKWHFQVRGYSFYFLSIPILTELYLSIESGSPPKTGRVFLFGLVSGLSVWCLELGLTLIAAMWGLLILRRKLSTRNLAAGLGGFVAGYGSAIIFNVTHHFANWRFVFGTKLSGGGGEGHFHLSTFSSIFIQEMPKFFGPDTVLWYYPEKPLAGYVFYGLAIAAVFAAVLPFLKKPAKILRTPGRDVPASEESRDFLMLVLTLACFVPYLTAPIRVASYFLGGEFFLAVLMGRLLERGFRSSKPLARLMGMAMLLAVLITGLAVAVDTGRRNEIETLTVPNPGDHLVMARIPGADMAAVENHLRRENVSATWATISFINPLIFESDERLAVSGAVFGWDRSPFPEGLLMREPDAAGCRIFVMEKDSPFRALAEQSCAKAGGAPPVITDCGRLVVIEANAGPKLPH